MHITRGEETMTFCATVDKPPPENMQSSNSQWKKQRQNDENNINVREAVVSTSFLNLNKYRRHHTVLYCFLVHHRLYSPSLFIISLFRSKQCLIHCLVSDVLLLINA